jgi:hypothetical protein
MLVLTVVEKEFNVCDVLKGTVTSPGMNVKSDSLRVLFQFPFKFKFGRNMPYACITLAD